MGRARKRDRLVLAAYVLLVLASFFVRIYGINDYILHHDEGVNGFFTLRLFRGDGYSYDPYNYHGPSLYYLNLIPFWAFGPSSFSLRLIPAVFGAGLVLLLFPLRRYLGKVFLLAGSAFLAFSPTLVYYSRHAIHEQLLVFFTASVVVSFYLYVKKRKAVHMYALAISMALLLATKETAFFILFIFMAFLAFWYWRKRPKRLDVKTEHVLRSLLIFLVLYFALFSFFFTDVDGIRRSVVSPLQYLELGVLKEMHVKPFHYYLDILLSYELPILLLAICAGAYGLLRRDAILTFLTYWLVIVFLCYSILPYKTPWLVINITLPMAVLGAYFLERVHRKGPRPVLVVLVIAISAFLIYQTVQTSFIHLSEDGSNKLAYAHTNPDMYRMLAWLEDRSSEGRLEIQTDGYSQWPLPWYFDIHGFVVRRDPDIWDGMSKLDDCTDMDCDRIELDIDSRLAELGYPVILGYRDEVGSFSHICYTSDNYQLRDNFWVSIIWRHCD